ncbi:strawberry notch-like NTP hydrolase domain-containing protein [Inquilinus sp.]|uniref:strawberry notch-like NTP hydrolase domain-containing protein n=1 Tax=Inquilinus sp. TaxID=1932117 RepID=UPI00378317F5
MVFALDSIAFDTAGPDTAAAVLAAARQILPRLERGVRIDAVALRAAMEAAFGASDAGGAWDWKTAYEACEVATVLFLRKYGSALRRRATTPEAMLQLLDRVAGLLPTHTRRSEESQALQQFSTPIGLGLAVATAAGLTPQDLVLEPSAGTGLLAILAELEGSALILNELAETRAGILARVFDSAVTRHDAAQIHDRLDAARVPTVVLMNPPFSVAANVDGRVADAAFRHIFSALARLAPGGRLVAISGASLSPDNPGWRDAFIRLQEHGRVRFTAAVSGSVYARHGTTFDTRLTVIDKVPAEQPALLPSSHGLASDVVTLLRWIGSDVPVREPVAIPSVRTAILAPVPVQPPRPSARRPTVTAAAGVPLEYDAVDWVAAEDDRISEAIYEPYRLQSVRIPGAQPHTTQLVQSAAMASVAPPKPSYRPTLPGGLVARGLLSDAQLESLIYAGEAHSSHIAGAWSVDDTWDVLTAAPDDAEGAVQFRRGWFLGDGTGVGKGRQAAGIILDNWLQGRRRALWISKNDSLLEDAQRDWSALGEERLLVQPLSRFRQGTAVTLEKGILFTTYATLRSEGQEKASRLQQIVNWLGRDFDGVVIFDEAHAMQNAAAGKGARGDVAASQQGRAGLRLQHALPDARVVYISATGATAVANLAYAQRLGLWGGDDFPFADRADFVTALEEGGVAAAEVLARDLKALGLYAARSLSVAGVEYQLVEHTLTDAQIAVYDAYADAFAIIHRNLTASLEAAGVTSTDGRRNGQAMSAARSAFESTKQRFFNHLITAMKVPTLIASIKRDLAAGHAAVVQLVSTGAALTERRLAEIPTDEWSDVRVDVTPREYVLEYLSHGFPTQLYEEFSVEGQIQSRPVFDAQGQPVRCREAMARRDALIEQLAALPAVPGALDQIVQHFGTDTVAEVTGRGRRIVRRRGEDGIDRMVVENRPASANLGEAQAFQDDAKRVLVFSDAGGTGRSYHADNAARNRRLRVHYLLEPGWKADAAIQGLGRTNRTNQAQPPLFRPIATNVKAETRFLSTIARRLDSLGALTKGQRQTGGQGLFRPEDNLESVYARDALRQLYVLLIGGKVGACSQAMFVDATGLSLMTADGDIKEELPPINTFLNRLLALRIDLQNTLFGVFEELIATRVQGAIESGTYDMGLETLKADSFGVRDRRVIHTHLASGAETRLLTIVQKRRNRPLALDDALLMLQDPRAALLLNTKSGRAAVQIPDRSLLLDDGSVRRRARLVRPLEQQCIALDRLAGTQWEDTDRRTFAAAWSAEIADSPEFVTSEIHMVTGLLLPIWKRVGSEHSRVYRLQADDGERIIGRKVSPAWAGEAMGGDGPSMGPDTAFSALRGGKLTLALADGLQLRRVRVMGDHRIELLNFDAGERDRLKADGLFGEIIQWSYRMFVPTDGAGAAALARVLTRHPIAREID